MSDMDDFPAMNSGVCGSTEELGEEVPPVPAKKSAASSVESSPSWASVIKGRRMTDGNGEARGFQSLRQDNITPSPGRRMPDSQGKAQPLEYKAKTP
ncbi:hypothetical protein AOLI_G00190900 [Acnodon oligacanthus]